MTDYEPDNTGIEEHRGEQLRVLRDELASLRREVEGLRRGCGGSTGCGCNPDRQDDQ